MTELYRLKHRVHTRQVPQMHDDEARADFARWLMHRALQTPVVYEGAAVTIDTTHGRVTAFPTQWVVVTRAGSVMVTDDRQFKQEFEHEPGERKPLDARDGNRPAPRVEPREDGARDDDRDQLSPLDIVQPVGDSWEDQPHEGEGSGGGEEAEPGESGGGGEETPQPDRGEAAPGEGASDEGSGSDGKEPAVLGGGVEAVPVSALDGHDAREAAPGVWGEDINGRAELLRGAPRDMLVEGKVQANKGRAVAADDQSDKRDVEGRRPSGEDSTRAGGGAGAGAFLRGEVSHD